MYIVDFRSGWATRRDQCHGGASITSKALIGHLQRPIGNQSAYGDEP